MTATVFGLAGFGVVFGGLAVMVKADYLHRVQEVVHDNSHSLPGVVLSAAAGFGFLGAGVLAHVRRPDNRVGLLMVLVGVGFFAEDFQLSGNGWVHSIGMLFSRASDGFLVHLVLAFPGGRLNSRPQRVLAGTAYTTVWVLTPAGALTDDTSKRGLGVPNHLLVGEGPGHFIWATYNAISVAVAVCVIAILVRRWVRAGPPMRRVLAPVFLTGLLGAAGTVVSGLFERRSPLGELLAWVPRVALCLLPLGFLMGVWRVRLGRTAIATLLMQLRRPMSAAQLQVALARTVGDPSLRVGYWRPDVEIFVDGAGRPIRVPDDGDGVTLVERGGRRIAVLLHDPALREDAYLLDAAGAAAELALENQRLTAEVRAQLAEVRELAGRLVAAGDAERRRLERDLHDGAQQRLVTVALTLRMAVQRLRGPAAADDDTAGLLSNSAAGVDTVIGELRELARGIHPAILTDAGLVPALQALVERTPGPAIHLDAPQAPRLPPAQEATGYFVAAEALTNTLKHAHAQHVSIKVEYDEGVLHLEITDDGVGGAEIRTGSGLLGLRDRVAAVGGRLSVRSQPGHGTSVSASIPRPAGDLTTSAGKP